MLQGALGRFCLAVCFAVPALVANADDELIVYVYDNGSPVEGAAVEVDGLAVGETRRDGSLVADLGDGQHAVVVCDVGAGAERGDDAGA